MRKRRRAAALLAAAAAFSLCAAARAQIAMHDPQIEDDMSHPRLTDLGDDDLRFVQRETAEALSEIGLARLAAEKASSDRVRELARRVGRDYARANASLQALGRSKRAFLPDKPNREQRAEASRLAQLSGPSFDRAYVDRVRSDHESDVREYGKRAKDARDGDVRAFARETLATLEQDRRLALSGK